MNTTIEKESVAKNKVIDAASEAEAQINAALDVARALYEMMESDFDFRDGASDAAFGAYIAPRMERYLNILYIIKSVIFDSMKVMETEIDSIECGQEVE